MNMPKLEDSYSYLVTIYTAINTLPVGHCSKRNPRRGETVRQGQIPDIVSIDLLPPEMDKREMIGHRKGILPKRKCNASEAGTLVEPTIGYLTPTKMHDSARFLP